MNAGALAPAVPIRIAPQSRPMTPLARKAIPSTPPTGARQITGGMARTGTFTPAQRANLARIGAADARVKSETRQRASPTGALPPGRSVLSRSIDAGGAPRVRLARPSKARLG